MRTSVYLSNRSIAAVCGEYKGGALGVSRMWRAELPQGWVSNGSVVRAEELAPRLQSFISEHGAPPGKLTLVIDGDGMTAKVLDVPGLAPSKLRELLRVELTLGQPDGFLHDYTVISGRPEGGKRVFALAAERAQIEPFAALFASSGLQLRGIDVTQACALRFFANAPEYAGMSFICALADGADFVSMLFIDGEYSFADRSPLTEQRGTPAAAVEISRVLASMVQYAYGCNGTRPLSHAFISGLLGDEAQFYGDIGDALRLDVGPLMNTKSVVFSQKPQDWGPYLFCLGDLMG